MAESKTVYAITGVNRGIGLCMVQKLLARPQTIVIGTVRNEDARVQLLAGVADVVLGAGSKLVSVLIDYSAGLDSEDLERIFYPAMAEHGIGHVDVLIANAGHTMEMERIMRTTPAQMRELYEINTIGPLITIQALDRAMTQGRVDQGRVVPGAKRAAFVLVSSSVGSIGGMEPLPGGAYGPSKAAANWIVKAVHQQLGCGSGSERVGIVGVAVHPGWVLTRMGEMAAESWCAPAEMGPHTTPEESAEDVLYIADRAEEFGGKFVMEGGKELPW